MIKRTLSAIALLSLAPAGLGQESLCNPCVDPPRSLRLDGTFPRPGIAGVPKLVPAEERQRLGVITIADMLDQLPRAVEYRNCSGRIERTYGGAAWTVSECDAPAAFQGQSPGERAVRALRIEPAAANASPWSFTVLITDDSFVVLDADPADSQGSAAFQALHGLADEDFDAMLRELRRAD